ncbi:hypothetical protein M2102_001236 [Fusobacterium sp. PH5-7]|uniref:hypothetical protein n=1 Tax=Fusobacterium sp. PH5-7 TaxID=2940528 RepID=UPI0024762905|nr:hypothetical protein [Fusobacterium sp. PH5-7]MDH6457608.1 hypothetical protein [Fusobacterium sp. PH5-7]
MQGIEKKVLEYKENLLRATELRAKMVDAEISFNVLKKELGLTVHELRKLVTGELQDKEAAVEKLIKNTPKTILNRDKEFKKFQKILLKKGIKITALEAELKVNRNKIYRTIRGENINRDRELEMKLEKLLDEKLFC